MEGNLSSSRNMMHCNISFGDFNPQQPIRVHHHHQQNQHLLSAIPPTVHENIPLLIGTPQDHDINKAKSVSDEDDPSFGDEIPETRKGKRSSSSSQWHRVKWTDKMVRLLITAVSYINEEMTPENGAVSRRKHANLQKKGKWKSVSKVLAERGFFVSPQQCEDKFNDLNKRYKRLNEILGRGTCCEVVENPSLLDLMDHVSEKLKDEVKKILSSKHLHYEEMCSYHNGNRLHLPPDPELQRSLQLAVSTRDDHDENELKMYTHEAEFDDQEESPYREAEFGLMGNASKKARLENPVLDCNEIRDSGDTNLVQTKSALNMQWISQRSLEVEEQRLEIEMQVLELEKERFKWRKFCWKKDRELEIAGLEIQRMKLENERMTMELRRKMMELTSS